MQIELSKEELLKKIQALEEENKRLKSEHSSRYPLLTKEEAFSALKNLINQSTQNYTTLWEAIGISDRTLRNFLSGGGEDASEKTYGVIGEYYTKQLQKSEHDLLRYRAYTLAPDEQKRTELFQKFVEIYNDMLRKLEGVAHKRIYTIDERDFKASGEYVNGGFLVYKWSEMSYHVLDDSNIRIMRARKELYLDGIIEKDAQTHTVNVLKDYTFKSPTAAAEVICGRAVNGWNKRKSEGKTLDERERKENS